MAAKRATAMMLFYNVQNDDSTPGNCHNIVALRKCIDVAPSTLDGTARVICLVNIQFEKGNIFRDYEHYHATGENILEQILDRHAIVPNAIYVLEPTEHYGKATFCGRRESKGDSHVIITTFALKIVSYGVEEDKN